MLFKCALVLRSLTTHKQKKILLFEIPCSLYIYIYPVFLNLPLEERIGKSVVSSESFYVHLREILVIQDEVHANGTGQKKTQKGPVFAP